MNFCILGSHPNLSQAEIFSVLPEIKNPIICDKMMAFESKYWDAFNLMNTLGGTVKLGDVIFHGPIAKITPEIIADLLAPKTANKEGKRSLDFGLTIYGSKSTQKKFFKLPIQLKKELKARGYSVRWVTGKGSEPLSPAAVAKCKLTENPNADLCIMVNENSVFIGKTTEVQDADSWSIRDFDRPKRDSKNGMLPPKLARMMVNMAQTPDGGVLLDPFCGSGTVLMEAAIGTDIGQIIGSDIEDKQIHYTEANNNWLVQEKFITAKDAKRFRIFTSDVKDIQKFIPAKSVDSIVTEGYLGPPLHGTESQKVLESNSADIQQLWIDSLKAIKPLLKPSATLVIITPEYKNPNGQAKVDLDNFYPKLGFKKRTPSINVQNSESVLSYFRENQFVKRNITILQLI
ncbi:MAG: DNA methyltransferase [Patescibacteria group bacterium]|nr:DNA methyltransferase [Patescibacteria group bacterium]